MYSIVQSFAGKRFLYGCDACGKQQEGKLDETNKQTVDPPVGWIVDFGPTAGEQRVSMTCSEECRDRIRHERGILTLDEREEAQRAQVVADDAANDAVREALNAPVPLHG